MISLHKNDIDWLCLLVEKDIIQSKEENERTPHPLIDIRIERMKNIKRRLQDIQKNKPKRIEIK